MKKYQVRLVCWHPIRRMVIAIAMVIAQPLYARADLSGFDPSEGPNAGGFDESSSTRLIVGLLLTAIAVGLGVFALLRKSK